MDFFTSYNSFELCIALSLIPSVFVFLWYLIVGDFKNFKDSRKAYMEFTARDPVNCYQNYIDMPKSAYGVFSGQSISQEL